MSLGGSKLKSESFFQEESSTITLAQTWISHSSRETEQIGVVLSTLPMGTILCFFGDLGSGKTTLIKSLAKAYLSPSCKVCSPTFTYLNIYTTETKKMHHFDLYRLKDLDDFIKRGFEEYLFASDAIVCVEWSERIIPLLPDNALGIWLELRGKNKREITIDRWAS